VSLSPEEWTIIRLSVEVAALATAMCLAAGVPLGWLLARREFRGKTVLNGVVHLPLVLPPVVTGYLLLLAFGHRGLIGASIEAATGFTFAFRWTGAALAAALMSLPLMVRAVRLSIGAIDQRLEGAASTLGASPMRVLLTVTLPLAAPGILLGSVLSFIKALGEFGATITFVSNIPGETQTLSLAIYGLLQAPDGEPAAFRLMLLSIALALVALVGSELLARRYEQRLAMT
jgi:molybdate transport system permease protein